MSAKGKGKHTEEEEEPLMDELEPPAKRPKEAPAWYSEAINMAYKEGRAQQKKKALLLEAAKAKEEREKAAPEPQMELGMCERTQA